MVIRRILYGLLLLFFAAGMAGCRGKEQAVSYEEEEEIVSEVSMFAIVCKLDEVNGKITLRGVGLDSEVELSFSGGADVRDKYGDILSMSQVQLGSIVDAVYDEGKEKLTSLYISNAEGITKLTKVSGAVINKTDNTVQMNGMTYFMSHTISAFSDNNEIALDEICSEDQLTVWLYNDRICSVYVELGHGYVRLSDYASYIGGMVEIGYDVIVPVTDDMLLTVREGEYTLRIAKGEDEGTKTVKVIKNQEINISLADIAIEPKQKGSVLFQVTPADAKVYIDGKRVNTEGAIELIYGKHKIYITAEGYESYSASFNVAYAYKIKEYTLQLEGSTTEASGKDKNQGSTANRTTRQPATEGSQDTTEQGTSEDVTTENPDTKDVTAANGTKTANKVMVQAPIGASVYFDGEYLGIAPISFTKVTGSHIITFSQTGCLSKSYSVIFTDDGKDETLRYEDLILISSLIE